MNAPYRNTEFRPRLASAAQPERMRSLTRAVWALGASVIDKSLYATIHSVCGLLRIISIIWALLSADMCGRPYSSQASRSFGRFFVRPSMSRPLMAAQHSA